MFTEDLTVFFDTVNGFAETVTYQGSTSISAIFDAAFFADHMSQVIVDSTKPACLVRSASVSGVVQGYTILRGSTTYKIVDVQPDGTGITLLILEKQ